MKLYAIFLFLAFATSVYSINSPLFLKGYDEKNRFINELTKECVEDLERNNLFDDCIFYDENLDYKEKCVLENREKCINYRKDPFTMVPKCANDSFLKMVMESNGENDFACFINAEGKFCPIVENDLNGTGEVTDEVLLETCKSKACTEGLIKSYEYEFQHVEAKAKYSLWFNGKTHYTESEYLNLCNFLKTIFKKHIELLNSEKCTSQSKDDIATIKIIGINSGANTTKISSGANTTKISSSANTTNISSGANTIKISSVLIITLGLLLYNLI